MKVLIIGGGGREHTLAWKISQSPSVEAVYAAPGNAGIAEIAECIPVSATDIDALSGFAREHKIDLTVVGPEAPLVAGIVDTFRARGLAIFGFDRKGARLEGSKVWAKEFMDRHGIPTGGFSVFDDPAGAADAIRDNSPPYVIKADGLAAGKGVLICGSEAEAMDAIDRIMKERVFGDAGERIIIEEFLTGQELSILAIFDGRTYRLFVPSQDHKRAYDGDEGPNTGGMGAYAPVPLYDTELERRVAREIIEPTFNGMREDGITGAGVLYFGLIITGDGPKVLEYNCRFGDPETQVILPLFDGDLAEVMREAVSQNLEKADFSNSAESAVCVVVASGGYPGSYRKGYTITGIERAGGKGCIVFHAGTALVDDRLQTSGGRVLGVTALGSSLGEALGRVYSGVEEISFTDRFFRRDIGGKGLQQV